MAAGSARAADRASRELVISNRSDVVEAGSPLRGQALTDLVLHLEVESGISDTGVPSTRIIEIPLAGPVGAVNGVAAGQTIAISVNPGSAASTGGSILTSWGTLVGSVTMSNDDIYLNCPAVAPWKNHGQYVRCVALLTADLTSLGVVSEEEADGVVSAAARSEVGK